MSHYRNLGGGRRDKNEPEIMQRLRHHGWHPEQVSGNRQWDLNAYPPRQPSERVTGAATLVFHVDVKGPNGKVEDAQREKWTALSEKGIPVYVCRTKADVDALVRGELEPWAPEPVRAKVREVGEAMARTSVEARDEARRKGKGHTVRYETGLIQRKAEALRGDRALRSGYAPPRSTPVDAAKEAEETFAPPTSNECAQRGCTERSTQGYPWCPEHTP
jgi:hypothetical protein